MGFYCSDFHSKWMEVYWGCLIGMRKSFLMILLNKVVGKVLNILLMKLPEEKIFSTDWQIIKWFLVLRKKTSFIEVYCKGVRFHGICGGKIIAEEKNLIRFVEIIK